MSKKPLPLPLGEVARRSRVGEGLGFSMKIPEKLIFASQISGKPSQSCCRMTTACGRSGRSSDSPPGCHSLLRLRFAYPQRVSQETRFFDRLRLPRPIWDGGAFSFAGAEREPLLFPVYFSSHRPGFYIRKIYAIPPFFGDSCEFIRFLLEYPSIIGQDTHKICDFLYIMTLPKPEKM